jgi:branched-chain amino acid transport system substrate-binding protein
MKFDRRELLLGGAGTAASLMIPGSAVRAQSPASIGTFPDGVSADSVFVGLTIPLTGVFSGDGGDLKLGYELAIAQINAGDVGRAEMGYQGQGRSRSPDPLQSIGHRGQA